jgi:hypothetical protein
MDTLFEHDASLVEGKHWISPIMCPSKPITMQIRPIDSGFFVY